MTPSERKNSQFKHGGGPRKTAMRTDARESERRNSQFKHGGGPEKTRERRETLSDDEMSKLIDLGDDDIAAMEDAPPELQSEWDNGGLGDERSAAQALNALNLFSFGFGDEIISASAGAAELARTGDWDKASQAYDERQKYNKDLRDRWEKQPDTTMGDVASYAIGIGAGAPVAAPVFRGMQAVTRAATGGQAATRLGRFAQNAAASGATGGVAAEAYAYGEAEGNPIERAQQVAGQGYLPLAIGAGLGLAAPVVGAGVGTVVKKVATSPVFKSARDRAARYIAEQVADTGQTVDDALEKPFQKAVDTGKPVTLADVGPQGVRDAAATAARAPGPGREIGQKVVTTRQEGQVARVSDDVGDAVGGQPGSFTQTADEISAQRAAEAKPLYDKAMSRGVLKSKKIIEITNRPSGKSAMERGLKIARDEGIPDDELFVKDAQGNVVGYTTKALHYMKLGLDDMIESAQRSGDNQAARAYTIMKNELLGEMDRLNPDYAAARKVFAGHAANQRALEQGRKAASTRTHPDQIKAEMAKMSDAEREMYRRGFAQKIIEDVENAPDAGNAVSRVIGNTAKRERLRAILGDEEYAKLMKRLGVENDMYATYRSTNVGSETAQRVQSQADMDEFVFGSTPGLAQAIGQSFQTMSVVPLLRAVGMGGIANLLRGMGRRVREEVAKLLFSSNPKDVRKAIQIIRTEYAKELQFRKNQEMAIAGLGSAGNDEKKAGVAIAGGAVAGEAAGQVYPF